MHLLKLAAQACNRATPNIAPDQLVLRQIPPMSRECFRLVEILGIIDKSRLSLQISTRVNQGRHIA